MMLFFRGLIKTISTHMRRRNIGLISQPNGEPIIKNLPSRQPDRARGLFSRLLAFLTTSTGQFAIDSRQ